MKKFCLMLALMLFPGFAGAISFDYGENLSLDQVIYDDFYGAGWLVDISQSVSGDVIIAGGSVRVAEDIEQDLIVFGGQVTIEGNVGDDLKIFGGNVEINGSVGDDVIGAGGNVVFGEGAEVGGSINLSSLFTRFEGKAHENFSFRGGTLIFAGEVDGFANLDANVLQFSDGAMVGMDLYYKGEKELSGVDQYVSGNVNFVAWEHAEEVVLNTSTVTNNLNFWAILSSILNLFVIGLLIYAVSPILFIRPAELLIQAPSRSFVYGMEILVVVPLFILLLFLVGWFVPLAFLITALWFIVLYLARIFTALAFGLLVLPAKKSKKSKSRILVSYGLGLAIYEVLVNIPLFGFWIWVLAMIFGAGALLVAKIDFFQSLCKKKII